MTAPNLTVLTSWYSNWTGLKVAVLGLGAYGFAVADTLVELACVVKVFSQTGADNRAQVLRVIGAEVIFDDLDQVPKQLVEFQPDLLVISSDFHPGHPVLVWARQLRLPLWSDIELAWRVCDKVRFSEWILVTGTNGKSIATELTAFLLQKAGIAAAPCGNSGTPVLDAIRNPGGFDVLVVELSSFQLHYLSVSGLMAIRPWASVVLNVAADSYLDWHGSRDEYQAAKSKVYQNVKVACIYNRADPITRTMVEEADVVEGARAISFGLDTPGPSELGAVDGILCDRAFLEDRFTRAVEIITISELQHLGLAAPPVVINILAATALARSYGVGMGSIHDSLAEFRLS